MAFKFRQAICNEVFQGWDFAKACKAIREAGYDGIEIAPFTLAEDPACITPAERREYRDIILSEGLEFVGLHWLMVSPKGLHVTTSDAALREKSWQHIRHLIELCADLGGNQAFNGVLVFGSPQQRATVKGVSREEATQSFIEGIAAVAPRAEAHNVSILVEALPKAQCDVVQSLSEAAGIVEQIGSPAVWTMFDVHNAVDEVESHATLVERYFDKLRHVHVNEMDGRHPGTGDYDFVPLFETLRRLNYQGWVSMEAFDFSPGALTIANDSLRYLETQIEKLKSE